MFTVRKSKELGDYQLIYRKSEYSFDLIEPAPEEYTLLVNYVDIGLNADYEFTRISGYCPHQGWIRRALPFPSSVRGVVKYQCVEPFVPGVSIRIGEYPVYYDDTTGYVFIGESLDSDMIVEFLPNVMIALRAYPSRQREPIFSSGRQDAQRRDKAYTAYRLVAALEQIGGQKEKAAALPTRIGSKREGF